MTTRMRSPRYPSTHLAQAIEFARKLHSSERRNPADREVAAIAMGFSGITGRSATVLADLIQYGLVEKTGKNEVRVAERTVDILHPEDNERRTQALVECAKKPALYQSVSARFPDGSPSDEALKSFFVREGFTDSAIPSAIRAFKETLAYIENEIESGSNGHAPAEDDESSQDHLVTEDGALEAKQHAPAGDIRQTAGGDGPRNMTRPVFDFETVAINTRIDNEDDLDELIERLTRIKGMLPKRGVEND